MTIAEIAAKPTITPVQQTERVQIVDILRGFALFGILFVNMTLFRLPFQIILLPADMSTPWHDQLGMWLIHFLGESKFYSLFSLLFGLGLTLLMVFSINCVCSWGVRPFSSTKISPFSISDKI